MVITQFKARCPFEIGDEIKSRRLTPVHRAADAEGHPLLGYYVDIIEETHTITDIVCMHSVKSGAVEFLYELDGHGPLVRLADPHRQKK